MTPQIINARIDHHRQQLNHCIMSKHELTPLIYDDIDQKITDELRALKNLEGALKLHADFQADRAKRRFT